MEQYKYVLELNGIVKLFPGVRALDGISLQILPGTVHIICGENGAGKSTLMKIISGEYVADYGTVVYKGDLLGKRTVMETMQMGISMIHQEMNPIKSMTIAQNIYLGREPQKVKGFVDFKQMNENTQKLLDELDIEYKATQMMSEVSIAGQQQIEIAKAISTNASIIIMDEPTSSISDAEIEILFKQINVLKTRGVAILYITHKMDEIFRIADIVSIIRDGALIETKPVSMLTEDQIITQMVGREISNLYPDNNAEKGDVVLEVKDFSSSGVFNDISFSVHAGEILGFSGLIGAGRSEVMRAIFGLDHHDKGQVFLDKQEIHIKKAGDSIKNGIAMVSEDRREEGIIPIRSIRENISLAFIKQFANKANIINKKKEIASTDEMTKKINVKASSPLQEIRTLSGGNQQKAILAKWLIGNTKVLILDEPTRGIDVGSKEEIHQIMCECAENGMAIIMVSSELPEIIGMSDRVIVMRDGTIAGELNKNEITQTAIMKLAA